MNSVNNVCTVSGVSAWIGLILIPITFFLFAIMVNAAIKIYLPHTYEEDFKSSIKTSKKVALITAASLLLILAIFKQLPCDSVPNSSQQNIEQKDGGCQ